MKIWVLGLACLISAGGASAQVLGGVTPSSTSVSIYGVLDTMMQSVHNSQASNIDLSHSGNQHNRLGFKGAEDLGDGLFAAFWLEGGLDTSNGTGIASNTNNTPKGVVQGGGFMFNRRATVGLIGSWGEVRLGREQIPHFWNYAMFDPFGYAGVGATQLKNSTGGLDPASATGIYASNAISYYTPQGLGGFFGQAMRYLGESPSRSGQNDGEGWSFRVGYDNGPFRVNLGGGRKTLAQGDIRSLALSGSWDIGPLRLMAIYTDDKFGTVSGKGEQVGGIYRIGVGEIKASVGHYRFDTGAATPAATKLAGGYVHHLSKRTALYTTYAHVRNSGGSTASVAPTSIVSTGANTSSSGFDLGIRHIF